MMDGGIVKAGPSLFLTPCDESRRRFQEVIRGAAQHLADHWGENRGPTSGIPHDDLAKQIGALEICPPTGRALEIIMEEVRRYILPHAVDVTHPLYAGYLHCAPMLASIVAELFIATTNQSLDSYDQGPSATVLEQHVMRWACDRLGFAEAAGGVFTSGATQSNLMGLLLARNRASGHTGGHAASGLGAEASEWRIFCSEHAHFSINKGSLLLGLGSQCVVPVPADDRCRLRVDALDASIERERAAGGVPIAVVLTAGTTDHGAVDPLPEAIAVARRHGLFVHVDAAVAGAFALAGDKELARGLAAADSVAIDFHKLLVQSISCSMFVAANCADLDVLHQTIPYLDPADIENVAGPNLVGRSLQTTRRFDALKVFMSLRSLGEDGLRRLMSELLERTQAAAELVRYHNHLELLVEPAANILLLRWQPREPLEEPLLDRINAALPLRLWRGGKAAVGRTIHRQRPALKLTFLPPAPDTASLRELLGLISAAGEELAIQERLATSGARR